MVERLLAATACKENFYAEDRSRHSRRHRHGGPALCQVPAGHPWFELTWVGASDRSAGKKYRDATSWRLDGAMPAIGRRSDGGRLQARQCAAPAVLGHGCLGGHRDRARVRRRPATWWSRIRRTIAWSADVPLLVPEVNPDHLKLIPVAAAQSRLEGPDRHQSELLHGGADDGARRR